jgi:asparagine synthase (glutamine-hydrolysing)
VALMQAESGRPVRTYTIGFDVAAHDESRQAAAVAAHIGTEHTGMQVNGRDALDVVPSLPDFFDEPLADPSAIPTYLVSRLARGEVTVALTGDGGDEVFAGYNRYIHGARLIRTLSGLPTPARMVVAAALEGVSAPTWDRLYGGLGRLLPGRHQERFPGEKLHKIAALMRQRAPALQYRSLLSACQAPESLLRASVAGDASAFEGRFEARPGLRLEEKMMLADQGHYLPDDLLAKLDRASMAVSLEARAPLLDHRVVEFGWKLPLRYKINGNSGKWLLKQVLYRHVPRELVERPKVGFSVPISEWLRGPLAPWAEHLVGTIGQGEGEVLAGDVVRRMWSGVRSGERPEGLALWTVLGFLAWRERWQVVP